MLQHCDVAGMWSVNTIGGAAKEYTSFSQMKEGLQYGCAYLQRFTAFSRCFCDKLIANLEVQGGVGLVHALVELLHTAHNLSAETRQAWSAML